MKMTKATVATVLICFIVLFLIFAPLGKTLLSPIKLTVNVNKVLSDVSNNPVGISLNFAPIDLAITKPLKDLNLGTLRYPEGELGDKYLFNKNNPAQAKVAIADPKMGFSKLYDAEGNWYTTLSFDDFVSISKLVEAEPFVIVGIDSIAYTGNAPHATPEEVLEAAIEWVRYANIVRGYGIKYWEIGNENNLPNRLIKNHLKWTAENYANTVVQFSKAMKAVDPSIKIGANGMRTKKKNNDWWERIMPIIKDDIDFLVTHQYSWIKNYQQWKDNVWDVKDNIEYAGEAIDTYNPELRINITEISSLVPGYENYQNTWKMLHNFEVIATSLCFKQVDYVHFWTSRWFGDPNVAKSAFNSDYEPLPMSFPLKILGNFLKKKMVYSSKSGTIRSWASYDPDDKSLNVFLLNKDEVSQDVDIKLDNYTGNTLNERWVLKGLTPESTDIIWELSNPVPVSNSKIRTKLEPLSVTVIAFQGSGSN